MTQSNQTRGTAPYSKNLVTNDFCDKAFSVQVKANAGRGRFWLAGSKAKHLGAPSHVYVLVHLDKTGKGAGHKYFVVPSRVVQKLMKEKPR